MLFSESHTCNNHPGRYIGSYKETAAMFSKKYHLYLTEEEKRLIIMALVDERNALIREGRFTDAVDDLIVRFSKKRLK